MKKWILGAVAFAALFWGAYAIDHKHNAPAHMPIIVVADPVTPEPAAEPAAPVASAPLPPKRPVAKHKANPVPKPPARAVAPMPVPVTLAPVTVPCYFGLFICV